MKNTKDLGTIIIPFPSISSTDIRDAVYPYIIELKDREIKLLKEQLKEAQQPIENLTSWQHIKKTFFNKYYLIDLLIGRVFMRGTVIYFLIKAGQPVFKFWDLVIIGISFLW